MRSNKKKGIIVLVLLLTIGFAALTATLTINGTINVGADTDNLTNNVIFTAATLKETGTVADAATEVANETDGTKTIDGTTNSATATISDDGKTITFTTNTLSTIGDKATLYYTVTNKSQYNVTLSDLTCTAKDASDTDVTAAVITNKTGEYIKVTASTLAGTELATPTSSDGTSTAGTHYIEAELIKSYVGDDSSTTTSYTISCTITATESSQYTAG